MIIQLDEHNWINVLQIVDVHLVVEKIEGVKLIVSMSNGKTYTVRKECEGFIKELEEYRLSVRTKK